MRSLSLLLIASTLISCISFPRAQTKARERQAEAMAAGEEAPRDAAPAVKTRENFNDRYFR